jgi:hypothetical protein
VSVLEKRVADLEAASGGDSGGCERCRGVLTVIRSIATGALYSASWNGQSLSDEELGERHTEFQCPKCGRDLSREQETVINIGWPQVNQYPSV